MSREKRLLFLCLFVYSIFVDSNLSAIEQYPYRWVYVNENLPHESNVSRIQTIVRLASKHGFNGIVLASNLDNLEFMSSDYIRRLKEVKRICDENHLEIIPDIFSVGYGHAVIAHNPNFAEGYPVISQSFIVKDRAAQLVPDPQIHIVNGGFEQYHEDTADGYIEQTKPGEMTFVDNQVFHRGGMALRFDNFEKDPAGFNHITQEIAVKPYRCYRLSCWIKTERLNLTTRGNFVFRVNTLKGGFLQESDYPLPFNNDWRKLTMGFNSGNNITVKVMVGIKRCTGGKCWVNDLKLEEVAFTNILRRTGTPLKVQGATTGIIYEEFKDYDVLSDPVLNFRFDHEGPQLTILKGGRIQEGELLNVSYYHGMALFRDQVPVCMSEPQIYDIWQTQAQILQTILSPNKYFLDIDEIRAGGTCEACKQRGITMAQILGDCITRQCNILKEINPKAEIFVWSDMLDPNQNARDNYYLVDGDLTGSWKYIPKDLNIVCWNYDTRKESLQHFSRLGFHTLAAAYYDGHNLDNPKGWLEALKITPGASGIMYTTWESDYGWLIPFGNLVSQSE